MFDPDAYVKLEHTRFETGEDDLAPLSQPSHLLIHMFPVSRPPGRYDALDASNVHIHEQMTKLEELVLGMDRVCLRDNSVVVEHFPQNL